MPADPFPLRWQPFGLKAYALYLISSVLPEYDPPRPTHTVICLGFEESSQSENLGYCG